MLGYHPQPIYSVYYPGGPRCSPYSPYPSYRRTVADPEVRYRRALEEYLSAEGEYKAFLRAREEARLRAHVEKALRRQERAGLLRAEISRPRKAQRVRELEQALAEACSRAEISKGGRPFRDDAPVSGFCGMSGRPLPELSRDSSSDRSSVEEKEPRPQHDANEDARDNKSQPFASEQDGHSVPNLESLLRGRLQKIVGDEEVQDVARAILRHLTPETDFSRSTKENACSAQPSEGADLSRSDALQGSAAEAAKECFRSHRAEVAEREKPSSPSPTLVPSPLNIIQDIRSALAKLSSGFSFPPSLDFTDDEPDGLAYTPTNAPLRVYEHALDGLLAQLDAVESDGDEEVRVVRRAAVKEVEKAIEDVQRRVTEAREGAGRSGNVGEVISFEGDPSEDKVEQVVHEERGADGPSSSVPEDSLDPGSSSPDLQAETSSAQDPEIVLRHDTTLANAVPIPAEDVLRDQSSSPILEPIPQAVVGLATPIVTATDRAVATSRDSLESKQEVSADLAKTDQTSSVPLESSASATPLEISTAILGAIAPSSTPVSPTLNSPVITEDLLASLSHDRVSVSWGPEGEDESDSNSADADDEHDWIEVGEL